MSLRYETKEVRDLLEGALEKLKEVESEFDDIEDQLEDKEREVDNLEYDVRDLEEKVFDLEHQYEPFPINTVYDEIKLDFFQEIWNKYTLEEMYKIFQFEPGKGIQLKLKKK
ncbi:MAG: hypothetical protein M0R46_17545 [Candidatus Muirbacterium halophilum]|nr:hypothetical protein [Candidatus Muirbacterium halophilum]